MNRGRGKHLCRIREQNQLRHSVVAVPDSGILGLQAEEDVKAVYGFPILLYFLIYSFLIFQRVFIDSVDNSFHAFVGLIKSLLAPFSVSAISTAGANRTISINNILSEARYTSLQQLQSMRSKNTPGTGKCQYKRFRGKRQYARRYYEPLLRTISFIFRSPIAHDKTVEEKIGNDRGN